eukprot:30947-Pelagococcus_subviridis.AAC.2
MASTDRLVPRAVRAEPARVERRLRLGARLVRHNAPNAAAAVERPPRAHARDTVRPARVLTQLLLLRLVDERVAEVRAVDLRVAEVARRQHHAG